ncbi:MAG: hypothetical protein U5L96_08380 [Owenweeksia sp.]|nr:hypothetical protein [Owenweeksia sp.]
MAALLGHAAMAQPGGGNLGQIELSVTEKYKAEVGEAVKLAEIPQFKDTTTVRLPINYRIISQPIEVRYQPEPISPARIARVPVDGLYQGMVRLGFGLYVTPMAEAYWNSDRSSEHNYGFWGRHFSTQSGATSIFDNNALSQNELGAYFNRFYRNMKWETRANGSWDKYSYYGIDELPAVDSLDMSDFDDEDELPEPMHNWYRKYEITTSIAGKIRMTWACLTT